MFVFSYTCFKIEVHEDIKILCICYKQSVCLYFIIAIGGGEGGVRLVCQKTFRLTNSAKVSRDRFVTEAREQVVSITL